MIFILGNRYCWNNEIKIVTDLLARLRSVELLASGEG